MGNKIASASLHINHFEQPKQQIAVSLPLLTIQYFGDLHLSVIQTYFGARLKKGALSIPDHLSLYGQVLHTMLIQNKLKEYANLRNTLQQYAVSIPELIKFKKTKPFHEHYKLPLPEICQLIQENAERLDSLLQTARNTLIDLVKGWTVDTLSGVIKKQTHNRYEALKGSVDGQVEVITVLDSLQMYPEHENQQPRLKWHDQNYVGSLFSKNIFQPMDVLIVMVHGFGGNSLDFQRMKSNIILQIGSVNFLSLTGLKEHIQEGVQALGLRAAKELIFALKSLYKCVRSISLIGFSLGGLILRAMLPHLSAYESKLNMLITFGSPHLGLTQLTKWQTKLGVYLLTRISRSQTIRDLCLDPIQTSNLASSQSMNIPTDHNVFSPEETSILSDLASCQELSYMNCVVLVASERDEYVPSYSALATYKGEDNRLRTMQAKMERNMRRVVREMYEMEYQENFFDSITLRKRHICLLQNQPFLRHFFAKYAQSLLSI